MMADDTVRTTVFGGESQHTMAPRQAKDQSRARLLHAGREEFIAARTGSATDVLAHLRLENIAERAGYSGPGMIYNLWKDAELQAQLGATPRELYLRDLLVEVASAPYRNNTIPETIGKILTETNDQTDFVRAVSNHEYSRIVDGLEDSYIPFWSLISGLQVAGVAASIEGVEQATLKELAELYELGLVHFGLQMKEPLTIMHLALSLRSLQAGFAETYAIHEAERDRMQVDEWLGLGDWTLFGIASHCVLDAMTEPATPEGQSAD